MAAERAFRVASVVAAVGCFIVGAGCQRVPTAPASPGAEPQRQSQSQSQIQGQVTDALLQGAPGATVEVLDGPDAGKKTVTGTNGTFEITSTALAGGQVNLRASKDGHQPATARGQWVPLGQFSHVTLRMPGFEAVGSPEAGEYTLTVGIDLATARTRIAAAPCPGFPVELASRTYNARITEEPAGERWVDVTGATGRRLAAFSMFVAGDQVVFDLGGENGLDEDLPGFRLLTVWMGALPGNPSQVTRGADISITGLGEFRYCELKSGRGIYSDCSQVPRDQMVAYHACTSDRALMTLTRR